MTFWGGLCVGLTCRSYFTRITPHSLPAELTFSGEQKFTKRNSHCENLKITSLQAANQFRAAEKAAGATNCFNYLFLRAWRDLQPAAHTFIDVGASTGMATALFLSLWGTHLNATPKALGDHWHNVGLKKHCAPCPGICGLDNEHPKMQKAASQAGLRVFALEPSLITVNVLEEFFYDKLGLRDAVHIMHVAVSDGNGNAQFPVTYPGDMFGSLSTYTDRIKMEAFHSSYAKFVETDVITMDDFVAMENITHIDWMRIHTEGFDHFVLNGASDIVRKRAVDVITFAYLNDWRSNRLVENISEFHNFGYDCYNLGRSGVVQLFQFVLCGFSDIFDHEAELMCINRDCKQCMEALRNVYR